MRGKLIVSFITVCMAVILPLAAVAAEKFPNRPVSLTVNFGGGGGTDTSARILSKAAEKQLGVPISVSNKPGGLGTTGVVDLMQKKADGYNIGVATYAPLAIIHTNGERGDGAHPLDRGNIVPESRIELYRSRLRRHGVVERLNTQMPSEPGGLVRYLASETHYHGHGDDHNRKAEGSRSYGNAHHNPLAFTST